MKKKVLAIVFTLVLIVLVLPMGFHAEQTNDDCITFSSSAAFSLSATKGWDGTLQYSTDKLAWSTWDGSSISAAEESGIYNIYVRGDGNTKICNRDFTKSKWNLTTTEDGQTISCTGNIETLRGATGNEEASTPMADYCYSGMFYGCTSLTTAPTLPAKNLADFCYYYMFGHCASLEKAPVLPSTTLATGCYDNMFCYCTSLTTAPALPAKNLAGSCYGSMFYDCTSLKKAPALPATTLAASCYSLMFYGCSSLTTAPTLPAKNLAHDCYGGMFYYCTSLTTAPVLPAKNLAEWCYYSMFSYCTSLTTAPVLSAKNLAEGCYDNMFCYCTSLTTAPALPATTLAGRCYEEMFMGCTALTRPAFISHVTAIEDSYCCIRMYKDCTALKIYTAPTEDCQTEWLCTTVEGQNDSDWLYDMFSNTRGNVNIELNGSVELGVTYYILDGGEDVPDTGDTDTAIYAVLLIASMLGIGIITGRKVKKYCV